MWSGWWVKARMEESVFVCWQDGPTRPQECVCFFAHTCEGVPKTNGHLVRFSGDTFDIPPRVQSHQAVKIDRGMNRHSAVPHWVIEWNRQEWGLKLIIISRVVKNYNIVVTTCVSENCGYLFSWRRTVTKSKKTSRRIHNTLMLLHKSDRKEVISTVFNWRRK